MVGALVTVPEGLVWFPGLTGLLTSTCSSSSRESDTFWSPGGTRHTHNVLTFMQAKHEHTYNSSSSNSSEILTRKEIKYTQSDHTLTL